MRQVMTTEQAKAREAELLARIRVDQDPLKEAILEVLHLQEIQATRALVSCPREDLVPLQASVQAYSSIYAKLSAKPNQKMTENPNG